MEPNAVQENIFQGPFHDAPIVIFDLDTTDLSRSKEICQISAKCYNNTFNQYILPDKDISFNSSVINKLYVRSIGNERQLFREEIKLDSLRPRDGLTQFLNFLREQSDHKVLLAAHNCFTFDGITIIREMKKHNLFDTFQSLVLGFIDTLPIFKRMLPERVKEKKKFDLATLARDYDLDEISFSEGRHAAINVEILNLLITKIYCTDAIMKQHAKNLTKFNQSMPEEVEACIADLAPISNAVSSSMLTKIAKAGISIDMLKDVYSKSGDEGVSTLLQETIQGKPRVTNNRKIIQSIIATLAALPSIDS